MKKTFAIFCLIILLFPSVAQAFVYNRNLVLSDADLTNHLSMSLSRIESFIGQKGSGLAGMTFSAIGGEKTAGQILYDAAHFYRINPKYILVRLQMEQSLITDSALSQSQIDWAAGYGCPDGSACNEDYRGFFNQINQSVKAIRGDKYLGGLEENGTTISGWGPGITKTTLDGISVTPVNDATAVMYTYTPWVGKWGGGTPLWGGNSLFAKTWFEWFSKKYPDGSLLRAEGETGIWLIQNGKKRPFWSRSAFYASHNPSRIITVSLNDLDAYETGLPIKYGDYTLIRSPGGEIFLIVNGKKRHIRSMEVFRTIGFNPEEVIQTDWDDINAFPDGDPITLESVYPTGALLQSIETGGIWHVINGTKRPVWSKEIMDNRFPYKKWIVVTQDELALYQDSLPIKFKDGELVTSPGANAVWVISNGLRRRITSKDVFESLGYSWNNIITTSDDALFKVHPLGEPVEF